MFCISRNAIHTELPSTRAKTTGMPSSASEIHHLAAYTPTAGFPARDRGAPAKGTAGPGHDPISRRGEAEGFAHIYYLVTLLNQEREEVDYIRRLASNTIAPVN
ncbi:hypothetical protein F441_09565 [Phytophthora nicotianae CJ01A1]|uniref:Uncharacterized protein n=3 Tax=Phytophthora nicotianae TaxID=4792 RepID=W2ZC80_PHYNI|nr:hypothetical protein L915_09434 [Phytophthora nicotianae]ETL39301.1 hypothetical protein L916_09337 [Phytophthora nicotianae]ETP15748.1 hypothetical protein F441_09565 [Phytophthora nicotianae CJ01A1]ETP43789.1 hypothetical protein F442_09543 [Phytophthora nicotianae P10297]